MPEYRVGHIKRNPETGAVAVRTIQPAEPISPTGMPRAWLIASTTSGARFAHTSTVEDWPDVFEPELLADG